MVMEIKLPMRRAMNELKKDLRNFLGDEWLYLLFEVVVPCVQLSKFTRLNHYDLCILLFIMEDSKHMQTQRYLHSEPSCTHGSASAITSRVPSHLEPQSTSPSCLGLLQSNTAPTGGQGRGSLRQQASHMAD